MQIKTKKQLLDNINKCSEKINEGELFFVDDKDKIQAFNEGTKAIKQLFSYDTLSDREFPELDTLRFDDGLESFLVDVSADEIRKRFDAIVHDLEVCGKIYVAGREEGVQQHDTKSKKSSKKRNIVFWIWIGVVVVGLAVTLIFAIIQWSGKPWDMIAFAGIADAFVGGMGFVIERILDHKNSKITFAETDKEISNDATAKAFNGNNYEHSIHQEGDHNTVNNISGSIRIPLINREDEFITVNGEPLVVELTSDIVRKE